MPTKRCTVPALQLTLLAMPINLPSKTNGLPGSSVQSENSSFFAQISLLFDSNRCRSFSQVFKSTVFTLANCKTFARFSLFSGCPRLIAIASLPFGMGAADAGANGIENAWSERFNGSGSLIIAISLNKIQKRQLRMGIENSLSDNAHLSNVDRSYL